MKSSLRNSSDNSKMQCSVCDKNMRERDLVPGIKCTHYCSKCLFQTVKAGIQIKNSTEIRCVKCRAYFGEEELQTIFKSGNDQGKNERDNKNEDGKKLYDRWCHLKFLEFIRTQPNFRWCARADCGSGGIVEEGEAASFFRCDKCNVATCVTHRVQMHWDQTCTQYDAVVNSHPDLSNENWLNINTKSCPVCNHAIEKNDGCDHLTCQITAGGCGHEFCWRCLADYKNIRAEGNQHHKPTCQWYAPITPT